MERTASRVISRSAVSFAFVAAAAIVLVACDVSRADVRLPRIFSNHMVLQRGRELPIWGWGAGGEAVTIRLEGKDKKGKDFVVEVKTKTEGNGRWKTTLPKLQAGGPYVLTVEGVNKLTYQDVLVGEVWLCSGQSNMEVSVGLQHGASWWKGVLNYKKELRSSNIPKLRLFKVAHTWQRGPIDDVNGTWARSEPKTVTNFSGTAFFFGRKLVKELDVPVGLITAAVGGMPIEQFSPNSGQAFWYNGMIAPVIPFGIRGATWYQGETNLWAGDRLNYFDKQKQLIEDWRRNWKQGDFPFYLVQLAPLDYGDDLYSLPTFWEAQAKTLAVKKTGIVATMDIGDVKDVHPRDKRSVGERLALWALAKDYKKDIVCSGPTFRSLKIEAGKIRVSFKNVGGGLKSRNRKPIDSFEIAGDGEFVQAKAEIDGDTVILSSEGVTKPSLVRFAWHCMANPNLVNKAGLPAYPFRTGSNPPKISGKRLFAENSTIELAPQEKSGKIRYTLDGSVPGASSKLYGGPIRVEKTTTVRARFYRDDGAHSSVAAATFAKAKPRKHRGKTLVLGVSYKYYEYDGAWAKLPKPSRLAKLKPVETGRTTDFALGVQNRPDSFALVFSGFLEVTTAGEYTFEVTSDDGARLFVDGKLVVDNDGIHPPVAKNGTVKLRTGMRKINVVYFEGSGMEALSVKYKGPSIPMQEIPCWCEQ